MLSSNLYYAFISYSRKDNKAAAFMQRQLEHFRIPVKLVPPEYIPRNQKFIRPVFRDKRDLANTEHSFTEEIKAALKNSRYLLVICSPNAVQSTWVSEEISFFLKNHDNDYSKIVPVILSGNPGCGSEDECLPTELHKDIITSRNLPSMIPDEGFSEKEGWETGLVQALSFMLKVERQKIKATVDKEKQRQERIYTAIGVVFLLVLISFFACVMFLENRKADADARTHIQQALSILSASDIGQRDAGAAMLHLTKASRLQEAQTLLTELLFRGSWLVPVRKDVSKTSNQSKKNDIPDNFPLKFEYTLDTGLFIAKDCATQQKLWSFRSEYIIKKSISPDGTALLLEYATPNHHIDARDPWDGRLLWTRETVYSVKDRCFSPDGRRFAFLYPDGVVEILQVRNGKSEFERVRVNPETTHIEFTQDAQYLIASSPKASVHYFMLRQTPYSIIRENDYLVGECFYDSQNKYLWIAYLSSGKNTHLQAYDIPTLERMAKTDFPGTVKCLEMSADGKYLFVGTEEEKNGNLLVFKYEKQRGVCLFQKISLPFIPYKLACTEKECFVGGNGLPESPKKLWKWTIDAPEQCTVSTFDAHSVIKDFSIDAGKHLVVLGDFLQIYDLKSNQKLSEIKSPAWADKCLLRDDVVIISKRIQRGIEIYDLSGKLKWKSLTYRQPGTTPFSINYQQKSVAVTTGQKQFRILDITTGTALSEAITVQGNIESLAFLNSNENQSLALGLKHGQQAGYTIWNQKSKALSPFQRILDTDAKIICPLSQNYFYLGHNPNQRGYIVSLPAEELLDEKTIEAISRYTSLYLNQYGVTERVAVQDTDVLPHISYWDEIIRIRENAFNSGEKKNHFIQILDFLCQDTLNAREDALDLCPTYLPAISEYWFSFCKQKAKDNYLRKHPDITEQEYLKERTFWGAKQWVDFIFADPQVRYFANFYTQYALKLHPNSSEAKKMRTIFLNMTGDKMTCKPADHWEQLLLEKNIPFDKIFHAAKIKINRISSFDEINLLLAQLQKILLASPSWNNPTAENRLALVCIMNMCTMYATFENGKSMEKIISLISAVEKKTLEISPDSEKKAFQCSLAQILAEFYILAGDRMNAEKQMTIVKNLSPYDQMAQFTEITLKTLASIRFSSQENALDEWKKFQKEAPVYASIQTMGLWFDLEILKAKGTRLNKEWSAIILELQQKYLKGIPIQCIPNGQAEQNGWKNGDRILRFAGFPATEPDTFLLILTAQKIACNTNCPVLLLRETSEIKSTVTCKKAIGISF